MITSSNSSVKRSGLPNRYHGVFFHTNACSGLARVRTELFQLLVVPLVAPHPVQANRQSACHGDLGDLPSSSHGRRAVSISSKETLKVWDLESGREPRTLKGHTERVNTERINTVAITPDGRRAVSASNDKTLKVWDLESGRELYTLQGHSNRVMRVASAPDGRRAISASWDKTLKLWDLENGFELRALRGHSDRIRDVAVAADGRRAISASWDKTLKLWDLENGQAVATFTCDAQVSCCAIANSHIIVAGDHGGRVHLLALEFPQLTIAPRNKAH